VTRMDRCRAPEEGDMIMANPVEVIPLSNELVFDDGRAVEYVPGTTYTLAINGPHPGGAEHLLHASQGQFSESDGAFIKCKGQVAAWMGVATNRSVQWSAPLAKPLGTVVLTLGSAHGYGPVSLYTLNLTQSKSTWASRSHEF
ncbi:unnamed protein product, partial [Polarella glacialis]